MTFQEIYQEIQEMIQDDSAGHLVKIKKSINEIYNEICNLEDWHWLIKLHKFYPKASNNTGTVTLLYNNDNVAGDGTEFISAMEGMKFVFSDFPEIYKIKEFIGDDSLNLEDVYQGEDAEGSFLIFENEFDLPSNFRRPFTIKLNGRPLNQMDLRDYRKIQPSWTSHEPSDYIISVSTLILHPIPDIKCYGEVYFYADPTKLTGDSDVPLIPAKFHQILVYGGYIRVNVKLEDIEYNSSYEKLYGDILKNLYENNELDSDTEGQLEKE